MWPRRKAEARTITLIIKIKFYSEAEVYIETNMSLIVMQICGGVYFVIVVFAMVEFCLN